MRNYATTTEQQFEMLCEQARRGGLIGRVGEFVGQRTIEIAANCKSRTQPRQQVRAYVKTPSNPNTRRDEWRRLMGLVMGQWSNVTEERRQRIIEVNATTGLTWESEFSGNRFRFNTLPGDFPTNRFMQAIQQTFLTNPPRRFPILILPAIE